MAALNPNVLRWARETAGKSLEEGAKSLGIRSERLQAIEAGEVQPPRPLLLKMSHQYRRSLLNFYLAEPPKKGDRGQDFRTLPPERSIVDEARLDALIRDIKTRQNLVHSIAEDEEDAAPLSFIGSADMKAGVDELVQSIRATLRVDLAEYRAQVDYDTAFALLRDRAEAAGMFVLLIGDLGSHHSSIPVELFRGFAIADPLAPFVVINDRDSRPAWTFTLLHEMTHLWLGTTGISGGRADRDIEQFCNDVAGEFLLPRAEVRDLPIADETPAAQAIELISNFARPRFVSRAMVAYKLLRTGKINRNTWRTLDGTLHQIAQEEREKFKAKQKKQEGGPSYYVVRRHRLGRALLELVHRTLDAGTLSPVEAAKVLGVKPRSVYPLLADLPRGLIRTPEAQGAA